MQMQLISKSDKKSHSIHHLAFMPLSCRYTCFTRSTKAPNILYYWINWVMNRCVFSLPSTGFIWKNTSRIKQPRTGWGTQSFLQSWYEEKRKKKSQFWFRNPWSPFASWSRIWLHQRPTSLRLWSLAQHSTICSCERKDFFPLDIQQGN